MREIIYKYNSRGMYETKDNTQFGDDTQMKLIACPHDFSLELGGEVLRKTSFGGCTAVASDNGEVIFYDNEGVVIARAEKTENCYNEVRLIWKQDLVLIEFGKLVTVDYYPNCDGEYDRWGKEWCAERTVELHTKDNSVEIK